MSTAHSPIRIFLDMPEGPLARVIRQTLPSVGDNPTHVYVGSAAEADLTWDTSQVERMGLMEMVNTIRWLYKVRTSPAEFKRFVDLLIKEYGPEGVKQILLEKK